MLRDVASGAGTAGASASCLGSLDPTAPGPGLSRARAAARAQVLARCGGVAPADVRHACDPTVAAEYGQPCALATAAGLAAHFPALCAP